MTGVVRSWDDLGDRNPVVQFIDVCLRGVAQVVFQNNPLSGLLILAAVGYGAFENDQPRVIAGAVIGLVVGNATALVLQVDRTAWRQGTFGFNAVLTGIAVPTFLADRPLMYLDLVFGAAGAVVVTLALNAVFKRWGLTAYTFPFVLTTWILLLAAYQLDRFTLTTGTVPTLPGANPPARGTVDWDLVPAFLKGISQVFLTDSWISGLIILAALLVNSWSSALFAVVGTVGATLLALGLGADGTSLDMGLFGFNAVLTAIAVGAVLHRPGALVTLYTLFGIVLTVYIHMALTTVLTPLGIPALTGPFNIATWLLLLPDRHFAPIANHVRAENSLVTKARRAVERQIRK